MSCNRTKEKILVKCRKNMTEEKEKTTQTLCSISRWFSFSTQWWKLHRLFWFLNANDMLHKIDHFQPKGSVKRKPNRNKKNEDISGGTKNLWKNIENCWKLSAHSKKIWWFEWFRLIFFYSFRPDEKRRCFFLHSIFSTILNFLWFPMLSNILFGCMNRTEFTANYLAT